MSGSLKVRKQLAVEFEQLHLLLHRHPGLILKCRSQEPNDLELDALAGMLHSFYTGIENLFKRLHLEINGPLPPSEAWHIRLLDRWRSRRPPSKR